MSYKVKVEEEIKKSFEENPDLSAKTLRGLAEWFYMQGQLRFRAALEASKQRSEHYREYLTFEKKVEADQAWKDILNE